MRGNFEAALSRVTVARSIFGAYLPRYVIIYSRENELLKCVCQTDRIDHRESLFDIFASEYDVIAVNVVIRSQLEQPVQQ